MNANLVISEFFSAVRAASATCTLAVSKYDRPVSMALLFVSVPLLAVLLPVAVFAASAGSLAVETLPLAEIGVVILLLLVTAMLPFVSILPNAISIEEAVLLPGEITMQLP